MKKILPWHVVERSILREKMWLKKALDFGPFSDKEEIFEKKISSDEMLRQLSIAIVSGKIAASEINTESVNCLWTNDAEKWDLGTNEERHGGEWHRAMMNLVRTHFAERNFNVVSEPTLNWGRADLGIYYELIRLIEAPNKIEKDARIALRNRTMLEVLFSTGMRISDFYPR